MGFVCRLVAAVAVRGAVRGGVYIVFVGGPVDGAPITALLRVMRWEVCFHSLVQRVNKPNLKKEDGCVEGI